MIITEQSITVDNVFEQMALITKKKLIEQGILPSDANKISIEFVKERRNNVIKKVCKKK